MQEIQIHTKVFAYDNTSDPDFKYESLLRDAKSALSKSFSPYSGFRVSSAALLGNGEVVTGANQENASYPLCLCAEMVTVSAVSSRYPGQPIVALAITVEHSGKKLETPVSPCGACRQTILEFENRQGSPMRIILQGDGGPIYELESARALLPLSFDGDSL